MVVQLDVIDDNIRSTSRKAAIKAKSDPQTDQRWANQSISQLVLNDHGFRDET